MFVPFEKLPDDARIWVYAADQVLSIEHEAVISDRLRSFCIQWERHGNPLRTSFQLLHHRFLVIAVDESFYPIGGCAIDSSLRLLKSINQELGINFLARTQVACRTEDEIELHHVADLKERLRRGVLPEGMCIFNLLIQTKAALQTQWEIPIANSWLARSNYAVASQNG